MFARGGAIALAAVSVPALASAGVLHGADGVLAAAAGVGLVGVLFVLAALVQAATARLSVSSQTAVLAAGFGVRLGLYLLALGALSGVESLHRPTLAATTAVAIVVTLAYEMVVAARTPSLFWVRVDRAPLEGATR